MDRFHKFPREFIQQKISQIQAKSMRKFYVDQYLIHAVEVEETQSSDLFAFSNQLVASVSSNVRPAK